jgi:hypothetical protein
MALATLMRDIVDVLIPGDNTWPSGSEAGIHGVVATRLAEVGGEATLSELEATILASGGPIDSLPNKSKIEVVARFEQRHPRLFGLVRDTSFLSYYESPAVVRAIQGLGQPYSATPLPNGYHAVPFDPLRDMPRHSRGAWTRTEDVSRVDLASLRLEGEGA